MSINDINIEVRKYKDRYIARAIVNGDFYASAEAPTVEQAVAEAKHSAAQIEFDEWGNW